MKIAAIMNRQVATTGPDQPFPALLATMRKMPSRLLHVVDGQNKPLGAISSSDMLKTMLPFYLDSNLARAVHMDEEFAGMILKENEALSAKDIMATDRPTLLEDSHFLEAEILLGQSQADAVAVLDASGRLAGEVTRKAILGKLIELLNPEGQ
jgi:CBS domain-containing protein